MSVLVQLRSKPHAGDAPTVAAQPKDEVHVFETEHGPHVLVVDGSRVYRVGAELAAMLRSDPAGAGRSLREVGLLDASTRHISDEPPRAVRTRALSLAVAQKCNLACTYCYAEEGTFGGEPKDMSEAHAMAAIDLLFHDASPGERVSLAFLGGEPLANRDLVHRCTERARTEADARGVGVRFSITTNGTLLRPDDGEFFEHHGFAVTVSLDGVGEAHDRQRPLRGGQGSYRRIVERVRPLLDMQRSMQVSARVTVTPASLDLRATLDELIALGFHSVGFSPMLHSPTGHGEMDGAGLASMLSQMIECGEEAVRRTIAGGRYPFANLMTAVQEIHKGTHRPYPCGAGAGYLGVSADGDLYACHRFVQDPAAHFGHVRGGVDRVRQARWLAKRHVHTQSPCSGCWARYLCGGGCHHEVLARGRPACDYIRGWLDFALKAYVRLLANAPEHFA